MFLADFNHDGIVSVTDATYIQQSAAEMDIPDTYGGWLDCNIIINSFYSDYISGSAVKGTPITFTAKASDFYEEITYQFLINNKVVQSRSENNTFIYSFEKAGNYYVTTEAYNKFGFCTEYKILYTVLDSENTDVPRITEFNQEIDTINYQRVVYLHLGATGGTAPYTYSVKISGWLNSSLNDHDIAVYNAYVNKTGDTDWQLLYDENNNAYLYHDFSESMPITLEPFIMSITDCYITVQAKDANGTLSESKTDFSQWNMIG